MNDEKTSFALASRDADAPAPVLCGVQALGRLDGVLFELALRQTYRNTSERVLEVVYTFPLPHQAVLLGFASELNGARQDGLVVARQQAEQQYEAALAEGDAPVMLEALSGGLHSANIGNLKPGDELVLEVRFAQLLAFEQGRVRVAVPTAIAPRYGRAERAGLQPQQVPLADLKAEYPFALSVTVGEALAGAVLDCPTHRFTLQAQAGGERCLTLAPGAWLDRDMVITATPREPRPSLVVHAADAHNPHAPVVAMAALQPAEGQARGPIGLKLLVDCSGSMGGDSIASARAALRGVAAGLSERDHLSLSCFGSTVVHQLAPTALTPRTRAELPALIEAIEADLGGTEMEAALRGVFGLPRGDGPAQADVLLITDGEIWQAEPMVRAARASGHRIFAIGVGSAPAEGVLRALAEATGGACEFATPGEALEAAAQRMLHRMRQPVWNNLRIDWGATPAWQIGPGLGVFGGDTALVVAGFAQPLPATAVRLLADDAQGATLELARGEADAPCPGDRLPRLAAARRLLVAEGEEARALAVRYQLMSAHTNCILVHRRAESDRADEAAELHRVSGMLAAGWGGTGSVAVAGGAPFAAAALPVAFDTMAPAPRAAGPLRKERSRGLPGVQKIQAQSQRGSEQVPMPALATLEDMARGVAHHLAHGATLDDLALHLRELRLHADAARAIDQAVALGLSAGQAWLVLAYWVNSRTRGLKDAGLSRALHALRATVAADLVARAEQGFEALLGGYAVDAWEAPSRLQRLRRALAGGSPSV